MEKEPLHGKKVPVRGICKASDDLQIGVRTGMAD